MINTEGKSLIMNLGPVDTFNSMCLYEDSYISIPGILKMIRQTCVYCIWSEYVELDWLVELWLAGSSSLWIV